MNHGGRGLLGDAPHLSAAPSTYSYGQQPSQQAVQATNQPQINEYQQMALTALFSNPPPPPNTQTPPPPPPPPQQQHQVGLLRVLSQYYIFTASGHGFTGRFAASGRTTTTQPQHCRSCRCRRYTGHVPATTAAAATTKCAFKNGDAHDSEQESASKTKQDDADSAVSQVARGQGSRVIM